MLTVEEYNHLKVVFTVCAKTRFFFWDWNKEDGRLERVFNYYRLVWMFFLLILHIINCSYIFVFVTKSILTNKIAEAGMPGFTLLYDSMYVMTKVTVTYFYGDEGAQITNQLVSINFTQGPKYLGQKFGTGSWIRKIGFKMYSYSTLAVFSFTYIAILVFGRSKKMTAYVLLPVIGDMNGILGTLIYFLIISYLYLDVSATLYMTSFAAFQYCTVLDFWIKICSVTWPSESNQDPSVIDKCADIFRQCTLIMGGANASLAVAFYPTVQSLCLMTISASIFSLIRFNHRLSFLVILVLTCAIASLIVLSAEAAIQLSSMHTISSGIRPALAKHLVRPTFKRKRDEAQAVIRTLRPIRFNIGSFFFIDKGVKLAMFQTTIDWLVTLLLTF